MAASKGRVEVRGVKEVTTAMRRLEAQAGDLKAAHTAVASLLLPGIGMRSPRRSGTLAASWSAGATKTRARITSSTRYAGVIEYGWSEHGIEPARMVRATVDVSHAEILDAYQRELAQLAAKDGFEVRET